MNRNQATTQYYAINRQIKQLEERKEQLRKWLIDDTLKEVGEVHPGQTISLTHNDYVINVQVKKRTKVDDGALEQLLYEKKLLELAKKEVLDHDMVEVFFRDGLITDEDLRSIQGNSSPIFSLKIDKEVSDVQGINEGIR